MSEEDRVSLSSMQCPQRSNGIEGASPPARSRWVSWGDLHREPFRLFFPAASLAGLIGVALWPLLLTGWMETYPGPSHARLMVQGFFGGFIFGFMGTAMPRLVGARPLSAREAFLLFGLYLSNVAANTAGLNTLADCLFVSELVFLFSRLRSRCHSGGDLPPPSFVLVGLSFASAVAGTVLHVVGQRWELTPSLELLARLWGYHGFVLLAVLGAGGFLLPRFLGLGTRRNFPEGTEKTPPWKRAARYAKATGAFILLTFILEAVGWPRLAGTARAVLVIGYLAYEMPLERLRWSWRGVHWPLVVGLVCIPLGVLAAAWLPGMRATLLHLELVGGFALITFGVATRVAFGHSGGREKLERFQPWLTTALLLMLAGLAARMSGDFLIGTQVTHYLYGATCWIAGLVLWGTYVLPRVIRPDPES